MSGIEKLLRLAKLYAQAEGVELSTVSSRIFDDGKKLSALQEGRDIQVRRCEKAIEWLSSNWTTKAEWPSEIARPKSQPVGAPA